MPLDLKAIAEKWQRRWSEAKVFEANVEPSRRKFFITVPYPYVNGAPHVGHSYSFFRTDAFARFKRMQGFNVLFPQGFHATGEPILGAVERLRKGDAVQFEGFKASGATDEDIERFKKGPEEVARFWMRRWIADLQSAGMSYDWRRTFVTTDLTPTYSRFIEWQYNTLRRKGFVVQGTHPVIWCPHDRSPTGDHDRLEGEGESPVEYAVVKFAYSGVEEQLVFPCATLRPETTYGVTNLWLNPAVKYVKARVDGENWLVAESALPKLRDQKKSVELLGNAGDVKAYFGKACTNPATGKPVAILPSSFVSGEVATGVVMSVPAHAPYDYAALRELQALSDRELEDKGIASGALSSLRALRPVQVVSVEGYSEFPARDLFERMQVRGQDDAARLEKATSEVYKHEFNSGVLTHQCGQFSGKRVSEVKPELAAAFKNSGWASEIWESTGKVVCRCTTPCHVKILENQWFLKFSDAAWKRAVHDTIKKMFVSPEEARIQLDNTVDWLQNKACTRRSGLGTRLPWDSEWLVETLSDSTIYMAYYAISRAINEHKIGAENLSDEVFDFIFLGQGDGKAMAAKAGLDEKLLAEMRSEFEYFYPLDLRNSGKDLLQNHLVFFLFHHAAIFSPRHWPAGISVNGYVTVEGGKMSKSKGNFIPFSKLVQEFGADLARINIIAAGEGMDDADWKAETIRTYRRLFEFLHETAEKAKNAGSRKSPVGREERLLESRINSCVKKARPACEQLKFRTACQAALFDSCNALKAYLQRASQPDTALVKSCVQKIALMACPFSPHFSEEVWELLGNRGFASLAAFPLADETKVDAELEQEEKVVEAVSADVQKILGAAKVAKPSLVRVFVAPEWKKSLLLLAVADAREKGFLDFGGVLKKALAGESLRPHAKQAAGAVKAMEKAVNYYKQNPLPEADEFELLSNSRQALAAAVGCPVEVLRAEDASADNDPQGKAGKAVPFKPALFVE